MKASFEACGYYSPKHITWTTIHCGTDAATVLAILTVSGTVCFETCKTSVFLFMQVFLIRIAQTSFRWSESAEVFPCIWAQLYSSGLSS